MNCNLEPESFVIKLKVEEKTIFAKISLYLTQKEGNLFSIKVFSDDKSWSGNLTYEEAASFSEHLEENIDEYSRTVRDAFKGDDDKYKYDFKIFENSCKAKFIWKKTFTNSTATLEHGFATLERDEPAQTKDNIIDFLIERNKALKNKIQDLENSNNMLNSTIDKCNAELEKFVNIKESLESNLYGKFVQLINSKKRRISLLESHIATLESADS